MSPTSRSSLFRTLHDLSRHEVRLRAELGRTREHRIAKRLFVLLTVFPFIAALLFAVIALLFDEPWLGEPSLTALLLAYLGVMAQPLIQLILHRESLLDSIRHPFGRLLNNAEQMTMVDAHYLPQIEAKPLAVLELVHLEVKEEKEFFERRIALVVGAIEKVGLAPGLLAACIAVFQLRGQPSQWWILALAYATPALYLFAVMAHHLVMRLDRMAKLLELAMARKRGASSPLVEQPLRIVSPGRRGPSPSANATT